ncbi:MAG: hypothetical protein KIT84_20225 [Labilithrix sp.]|nr:hypothetical protein [Labilithrix sp.]MCW5813367.1 hypothetical protein [Labilithrix sp.]
MASSNGYPFTSRRKVVERITSEPAFALACIRLVDERRGWMASHRVRAGKVLAKIIAGDLSPSDLAEVISLISPYARTVSRILREREIAEGAPELAAKAAVFGVLRPASAAPDTREVVQPSVASPSVADTPAAVEVPVVAPKRRGRSPGSKNKKPRSESEPKRRRRS